MANAFVLYANYKHYHWQTYGPLFRDFHKLFDKFAAEVLETLDPIAERVRVIGPDRPAHPIELVDSATIALAAPHSTMHDMIEEANRNTLIVIKEMCGAAKVADEHNDPGTVDLFAKFVQVHKKHEWWLRDIFATAMVSTLQGNDMKEKTTGEREKPRDIANERNQVTRDTRERDSPNTASTGRDEKVIGVQKFPRKGDDEDAP